MVKIRRNVFFSMLIFTLFAAMLRNIQAQPDSVEDCSASPIQALQLPFTSGDLVYSVGETITSLSGRFQQQPRLIFDAPISPNGLYIADYYAQDTSSDFSTVAVYNSSGEQIYNGAPSLARIRKTHWLGNDQLLSFVATIRSRRNTYDGVRYTYNFGYFIIDPFAREYSFTIPPRSYTFDEDLPFYRTGNPFIVENYSLTYDGRYLFTNIPLYDFVADEPLVRPNFEGGYPSLTSHRLLREDWSMFETEGQVTVYEYDLDTDTSHHVITYHPDSPTNFRGWSPDETYIAYTLYFPNADTASFRQMYLLSLISGEIYPTCIGSVSGNVAWSRDSRYLALTGVLEGEDVEESLGVYIYDTQTGDIYQVYRGRADIIGWMAGPEE